MEIERSAGGHGNGLSGAPRATGGAKKTKRKKPRYVATKKKIERKDIEFNVVADCDDFAEQENASPRITRDSAMLTTVNFQNTVLRRQLLLALAFSFVSVGVIGASINLAPRDGLNALAIFYAEPPILPSAPPSPQPHAPPHLPSPALPPPMTPPRIQKV